MTTLLKLLVFSICLSLLTACGVKPDERVYGTWTEISTGEIVEFRQDKTLRWFGLDGTFEFRKSTNWASCIGLSGCPSGQVSIEVGGESFRASYYSSRFNEDPDSWYLSFRSFSAMPYDVTIDGRTAGGFQLYREGTVTSPMTIPGFSKTDGGLTDLFPQPYRMRKYDGELVATMGSTLHRFNTQTQTWSDTGVESWSMTLAPDLIFTNDQYSLDHGYTWSDLPFLAGFSHEGEKVAWGTKLYQTTRVDEGGEPVSRQTWRIDLGLPSPSWEMMGEEPTSDYDGRQIMDLGSSLPLFRWGMLIPQNTLLIQRSDDEGASWSTFNTDCVGYPQPHSDGFFCGGADDTLLWYSFSANVWTSFDIAVFDVLNSTGVLRDALYIHRDDKVVRIGQNGEEEVVVDYSGADRRPGVFIFEDEIWLNCITIWRKEL